MPCKDQRTSLEINSVLTKAITVQLSLLCHIKMEETGSAGALPLRINKHYSLELQIEKKVERQ